MKKPLIVTSGEPAGVGPELCVRLAFSKLPVVVIGDRSLLEQAAMQLNLPIQFIDYSIGTAWEYSNSSYGELRVLALPCHTSTTRALECRQCSLRAQQLALAAKLCSQGEFSGLVTAPVHKAIINQAGIPFSGHTEFFAEYFKARHVVMMLVCQQMRVALATTHLPLKSVAQALSIPLLVDTVQTLADGLSKTFRIHGPRIHVAGLNPHAGEGGYLGDEEIRIIQPAIEILQQRGIQVLGPFPADTLFAASESKDCDAFLCMYHDQGLPVLKYASFGRGINVTLGLPIIRTSVDHGTCLNLAGKGVASADSLIAATELANDLALKNTRE